MEAFFAKIKYRLSVDIIRAYPLFHSVPPTRRYAPRHALTPPFKSG